jgi:hypothetical protein
VVQKRLGHKSAVETLDTYSHLWPDSEDRTREAVRRGARPRRDGRGGGGRVSECALGVPSPDGSAAFGQVRRLVQGEPACKPASVSPGGSPRGWRPSIWDRRCRRPRAVHQGTRPGQPPRPRRRSRCVPYSTLLRVGFTEPAGHPAAGALLPHPFTLAAGSTRTVRSRWPAAVCFLWHCPAGHPDWRLASTLPCGGRTFLGPGEPGPRPPGRLPLRCQYATRFRRRGGILGAWFLSSSSPSSSSRWPSWP